MSIEVVRPADLDNAPEMPGGYRGRFLYTGESCKVIATKVPPGVSGPPNHIHPGGDQLYFIVEGETMIKLGSEVRLVETNSLIFIPAGVPHHSWNAGEVPDINLEIIAPSPPPLASLAEMTDSDDAMGLPYCVKTLDRPLSEAAGQDSAWLLGGAEGSSHLGVRIDLLAPGNSGPALHVHDVDQFYFVLDGALTVQAGLRTSEAEPKSLVAIPAGVPHRRWNAGSTPVRHLSILSPVTEEPGMPVRMSDAPAQITA